jgi:hypothetical protein
MLSVLQWDTLSHFHSFNLNPINASLLSSADKVHTADLSSVCVSLDPYPSFGILLLSLILFNKTYILMQLIS